MADLVNRHDSTKANVLNFIQKCSLDQIDPNFENRKYEFYSKVHSVFTIDYNE